MTVVSHGTHNNMNHALIVETNMEINQSTSQTISKTNSPFDRVLARVPISTKQLVDKQVQMADIMFKWCVNNPESALIISRSLRRRGIDWLDTTFKHLQ